MVTASPTSVGDVLTALLDQAMSQAAQQPDGFNQVFQQVGQDAATIVEQVRQLPTDAMNAVRDQFVPPKWWSLLVFLMLRIVEDSGDKHLSLGYRHPDGWSRMLTLTYSEDPSDLDGTAAATVGVAVTDPGVTHGIWLQVLKDFSYSTSTTEFDLQVTAHGSADWTYTPGSGMTPPAQQADADVDIRWTPWNPDLNKSGFTFDVGPIHLHLHLNSADGSPLYVLTLGLGTDTAAGVDASLDVSAILGPALKSFVSIDKIDESYSPQLILAQGAGPQFSLGQRGIG
jgi:hypothetical protein